MEKYLGKISSVEYGLERDYPYLMGIHFSFEFDGCGVCSAGKYCVNMNKEKGIEYTLEQQKDWIVENVEFIQKTLKDAKVNYVSQLKGKPVEIYLENRIFSGFRILTEVL